MAAACSPPRLTAASAQDIPVTPQNAGASPDHSFNTAVLDASSDEVHIARQRSRSEAQTMRKLQAAACDQYDAQEPVSTSDSESNLIDSPLARFANKKQSLARSQSAAGPQGLPGASNPERCSSAAEVHNVPQISSTRPATTLVPDSPSPRPAFSIGGRNRQLSYQSQSRHSRSPEASAARRYKGRSSSTGHETQDAQISSDLTYSSDGAEADRSCSYSPSREDGFGWTALSKEYSDHTSTVTEPSEYSVELQETTGQADTPWAGRHARMDSGSFFLPSSSIGEPHRAARPEPAIAPEGIPAPTYGFRQLPPLGLNAQEPFNGMAPAPYGTESVPLSGGLWGPIHSNAFLSGAAVDHRFSQVRGTGIHSHDRAPKIEGRHHHSASTAALMPTNRLHEEPTPSRSRARTHTSNQPLGPEKSDIALDEADPRAVAAALQYHRTSPSRASGRDNDKCSCELCGALVLRWAILLPCGHRACSACCCSGVNQVSTTPPRRHVCAACQMPVTGLTLSLPAAEAARAAAWTGLSAAASAAPAPPARRREGSATNDLAGRFPGVTEALLGLDKPIRGPSTSVVAAALARQPNTAHVQGILHSPKDQPAPTQAEAPGVDDSFNADVSLVLSEDASFYRPPQADKAGPRFSTPKHSAPASRRNSPNRGPVPHGRQFSELIARDAQLFAEHTKLITVIRIDNIAWVTSYRDILKWAPEPDSLLPDFQKVAQPIHIPIDLKSGKTANCAFVELRDEEAAKKLIRHRNNTKLCGRPVSLLLSNYEELITELFPSVQQFPLGTPTRLMTYVTNWQLEQLTQLLKNGGPQLKSPLKPIEFTTSIVQLIPDDISFDQRDLLAERALHVLLKGIQWAHSHIDGLNDALQRLAQAYVNSRAFTPAQRQEVCQHIHQNPGLFGHLATTLASSDRSAEVGTHEEDAGMLPTGQNMFYTPFGHPDAHSGDNAHNAPFAPYPPRQVVNWAFAPAPSPPVRGGFADWMGPHPHTALPPLHSHATGTEQQPPPMHNYNYNPAHEPPLHYPAPPAGAFRPPAYAQ